MTIELSYFNLWAVIVGIIIQMALGALWYSPVLFGNIWLRLVEKQTSDISREEGNKAMALAIIPATVFVLALALTNGLVNVTTLLDSLVVGTLVSVGFVGMNSLNLVFFEDRSVKLTLLNAGYPFVSLNLISLLITFWR